MWSSKGAVAVVGVAQTTLVRDSNRYLGPLALETCIAAIDDAGISPRDVGAFCSYTRTRGDEGPEVVDGVHIVSVPYMLAHLRPEPRIVWHATLIDPSRTPSSVIEAVNALAAGVCNYAVVWRASRQRPSIHDGRLMREASTRENGDPFTLPYGLGSPAQGHALQYQRYMDRYGATREHLARIVVGQRRNATLNDNAYFRADPLTVDQYFDAAMVSDPLSLADADVPVDGVGAIVLTTSERAKDLKHRPAYVAGFGENTARRRTGILAEVEDYMNNNLIDSVWSMSGLGPQDVDVAQLYDEYSPSVLYWLEAAGFCGEGEGFEMVDSGATELGGSLPVNTSGGQLGEGATEGMGQIIEAVRQITGRAGARQVENAQVSLVTEGSPMNKGGGILFTDEP
jgi:acetyl-CoA acetyltransferase